MSDERDTPDDGTESDGLDAWLAANFPPKAPDAAPPPPEPEPEPEPQPPAPPLPPRPEEASVPPPSFPPVPEPPNPEPPTPEPPTPLSSELPPVFPPVLPAGLVPPASPAPPGAWEPEPAVVPPVAGELPGLPPEPEVPADPTEVLGGLGESSVLDDLFGEANFREYEAGPARSENPFAPRTVVVEGPGEGPAEVASAGISTSQKVLLWIAGSLVAMLALLALFLLGTRLPDLLGPAPAVIMTPSSTPTPTATALPLGPLDPGDYRWDELLGGECLDPYNGPWEEEFTVVDCDRPHPAQLVARGVFGADDGLVTPYPGIEALRSQVNLLCTAPTVVDYAAAAEFTDIQFEASFAATAEDWIEGNRDYYCFLSRSSGGPITGSIAMPQVAPAPSEAPAP